MGAVRTYVWAFALGGLVFGLAVGAVRAGELAGHPNAYNDGLGPSNGAWTYSTPFDNAAGISGYIDWAVYGPDDFPYTGYAPQPGYLTYAFQVFSTGSVPVRSLEIPDLNGFIETENMGAFMDLGGELPTSFVKNDSATYRLSLYGLDTGPQAEWYFDGLVGGQRSAGLAYSSIRDPDSVFGITANGDDFAVGFSLPVPASSFPYDDLWSAQGILPGYYRDQDLGDTNVAYAVFEPGTFNLTFPGQDPSGGAEYIYAYQLEVSDTEFSMFSVDLDGDELLGSIGYIPADGRMAPDSADFLGDPSAPTAASWSFDPGSISLDEWGFSRSAIFYFTSPHPPEFDLASVTATSAGMDKLPSPTPEPATVGLLAIGLVSTSLRREPAGAVQQAM